MKNQMNCNNLLKINTVDSTEAHPFFFELFKIKSIFFKLKDH